MTTATGSSYRLEVEIGVGSFVSGSVPMKLVGLIDRDHNRRALSSKRKISRLDASLHSRNLGHLSKSSEPSSSMKLVYWRLLPDILPFPLPLLTGDSNTSSTWPWSCSMNASEALSLPRMRGCPSGLS